MSTRDAGSPWQGLPELCSNYLLEKLHEGVRRCERPRPVSDIEYSPSDVETLSLDESAISSTLALLERSAATALVHSSARYGASPPIGAAKLATLLRCSPCPHRLTAVGNSTAACSPFGSLYFGLISRV